MSNRQVQIRKEMEARVRLGKGDVPAQHGAQQYQQVVDDLRDTPWRRSSRASRSCGT